MSSSPTPEPENSHLTSTQEPSQGVSEAAPVAAEESSAKSSSTRGAAFEGHKENLWGGLQSTP